MDTLQKIKKHLEFKLALETSTMASFDLDNDEKMRKHCYIMREAYQDIYDYVVKCEEELKRKEEK